MSATPMAVAIVPVSRIFLSLSNPRHAPFDSEAKAIEYLCNKESVYPLARDIAKHQVNPLENFGLIPTGKRKPGQSIPTYYVAEGNRRLCAIKLLNDPDLAPPHLRKGFEKLSQEWTPIKQVYGVVFNSIESIRIWLDRVHNGEQDGRGRRQWNADQKARNDGGNKNKAAQLLLDYAEAKKMISAAERRRKLTTAQRFVGNDIFREIVGIDVTNPDELQRTRPSDDFDIMVRRFVRDLIIGKNVTSRMNKNEIISYARPLGTLPGITTARIEPEPVLSNPAPKAKGSSGNN